MKKNDIEHIVIKGAKTHNLKNIDLTIPRNKMVVFTGVSGSGKSSLAFDTIFAEGQRRYVESLSSYARQFLKQMQKPDVEEITGLSPAISIDQKSRSSNPRSTVATITEIYDYLRIFFARVGKPHCLICGRIIQKLSNEEIKKIIQDKIYTLNKQYKGKYEFPVYVEIYSPVVRGRKGEHYQLLYDLLHKGYKDVMVDGVRKKLRERIILSKTKRHEICVLVDEISVGEFEDNNKTANERLSEALEKSFEESEGTVRIIIRATNEDKVIDDFLMTSSFSCAHDGYSYPEVEPRLFSFNSPYGACQLCNGIGSKHFFGKEPCDGCKGSRLREEALHVTINNINIVEVTNMTIEVARKYFIELELTEKERDISGTLIKEILARLDFMINVGIEYLSLGRKANTLSGGEAQRIRLASQLGSGLVGALYVLDEPTIGLHQRDNDRLIKTLLHLRDIGNSIIVVEHDEDTIFSADYIVDIGHGAGIHGGNVIVSDYIDTLLTAKENKSNSLTLSYLRGEKEIKIPDKRRQSEKGSLSIKGGKIFNIENCNIDIPLGKFIAITGVSGSGKSTFMYEIIHKNLLARLERKHRSATTYNCKSFVGSEYVGRVILIDQSAIGRTPRSNPATYTGTFTFVRELFAETSEARLRGWKPSRFSFNVKGGRCEGCQGNGMIEVEMHFLPTVYVRCDICNGKRYTKETLEIKYKKKNIYEVLCMTVEEALSFFEDIPGIYDRLKTLRDVGLNYVELGQSATTLSGGEAQRIKIASELYRPHVQKTIYLLDEPTIGLHYEDVAKLIEILQKLVNGGNTVVVIEHNMDLIKSTDFVIDIGPEGGIKGGKIVAKGTPEEVANNANSYTGHYLKRHLKTRGNKR